LIAQFQIGLQAEAMLPCHQKRLWFADCFRHLKCGLKAKVKAITGGGNRAKHGMYFGEGLHKLFEALKKPEQRMETMMVGLITQALLQ